jgi:hypothetical protein
MGNTNKEVVTTVGIFLQVVIEESGNMFRVWRKESSIYLKR